VIHTFLEGGVIEHDGRSTIEGFEPTASECYFWQRSLSAFRGTVLESKVGHAGDGPIFLLSLAGLAVIGATLADAADRRLPLYVIQDGVADGAYGGIPESNRLSAITTLARVHGRCVSSEDAALFHGWPMARAIVSTKPSASAGPPPVVGGGETGDLAALEMMARYLADELAKLVPLRSNALAAARVLVEELSIEAESTDPRASKAPKRIGSG
jgi:hypothetical protein